MADIVKTIDILQKLTNSKISQSDIARALNITRSTISKRIKTNSGFSFEELKKIGSYYSVNLLQNTSANPNEEDYAAQAAIFSHRINAVRKMLNLSLKELAQKLNIPEQTAAGYEAGVIPSIFFPAELCRKCNVNANWFLTGEGSMFNDISNIIETSREDTLDVKVEEILKKHGLIK